jgi:hypothetical protein
LPQSRDGNVEFDMKNFLEMLLLLLLFEGQQFIGRSRRAVRDRNPVECHAERRNEVDS